MKRAILVIFASLWLSLAAWGDTLYTFEASSFLGNTVNLSFSLPTFQDSGNVSSFLTVDTSYSAGVREFAFDLTPPGSCTITSSGGGIYDPFKGCVALDFNDPGVFMLVGGFIEIAPGVYTNPDYPQYGTLAISNVPEPSALMLLGAGLLGVMSTTRKKVY